MGAGVVAGEVLLRFSILCLKRRCRSKNAFRAAETLVRLLEGASFCGTGTMGFGGTSVTGGNGAGADGRGVGGRVLLCEGPVDFEEEPNEPSKACKSSPSADW